MISFAEPSKLDSASTSTARQGCGRAKTVLLLPSKESSLKEMLFISECLEATARYKCVFVAKRPFHQRWLDAVRQKGHALVLTPKARQGPAQPPSSQIPTSPKAASVEKRGRFPFLTPAKTLIRRLTRPLLLESLCKYYRYRRGFRRDKRLAEKLLDEIQPQLILTPSDRSLGLETALLAAAQRRRIPSMVIPWAVWSTRGEVYSRTHRPDFETQYSLRRYANRVAARKHPQAVIADDGNRMLYRPGEMILAAAQEGVLPPHPLRFFGGCGLASKVAVESAHFYELCIERGIPQTMLAITGRVSTDLLSHTQRSARVRRAQLNQRLKITSQERILLCALPNTAEQKLCSWENHWEETAYLLNMLTSLKDVRVIVNLHPKCDPETYREIVQRYGAALTTQPIEQFIPLCDVFVSTNSSTIVMAVGCQKPVVNLEIYGVADNTYEACPGVITVRRHDQARFMLQRILGDRTFFEQLREEQRQFGDQWILMDGRCGRRLIAEADALIDEFAPLAGHQKQFRPKAA